MRSSLARVHHPADDLGAVHGALDGGIGLGDIAVAGDPNGVACDRQDDTVYVADGGGAVIAIARGRPRRIAAIGAVDGACDQLGGIAIGDDGALYVARLGHGRAGAIVRITARGAIAELPGLSPELWRLGVAYAPAEHALYATQYAKRGAGPCDGAVVRIDLASGDLEPVLEGLGKPVGVALLGSTLVVSDARRRAVICADLGADLATGRGRCTELALGARPDAIAACGADSVIVTTYDPDRREGSVHRLWLDGTIATLATGAWQPRGVACDGDRALVAIRRGGRLAAFAV